MHRSARHGTHVTLLTRVFDKSIGDVLELGTGHFSTKLLDWLCSMTGRRMVSYETGAWWYERASKLQSSYHEVIKVDSWDLADIATRHWGMVFIDHGPNIRRIEEIKRLAMYDNFDYMVIHDTEPQSDHAYHYSEIWPLFKYRYDYTKITPWTSVVSNSKDLRNIE